MMHKAIPKPKPSFTREDSIDDLKSDSPLLYDDPGLFGTTYREPAPIVQQKKEDKK